MIKRIKIKNFKCFNDFEINNLSPITILGGKNNVGKSTILEAVLVQFTMIVPNYFALLMNMHNEALTQNTMPYMAWNHLFHNMNESDRFDIEYERILYNEDTKEYNSMTSIFSVSKLYDMVSLFQNNEEKSLLKRSYESIQGKNGYSSIHMTYDSHEYKYSGRCVIQGNNAQFIPDEEYLTMSALSKGKTNPPWPYENTVVFKNSASLAGTVEWLSKTILDNEKKAILLDMLRLFDKDIISISPVIEQGNAYVYVTVKRDNKEKFISLNYMGDGLNKAFQLLLAILNLPNGILLIDEIENGIYYELYEEIMTVICKAALEMNCQVIMTTHSRDIVEATLTGMEKMGCEKELCYQRIDISEERAHKAHAFYGDGLRIPFDIDLEIR